MRKVLALFLLSFIALVVNAPIGLAQPKPAATPDIEEQYAKDSTTEINVKNADIAAIVRIFSKKTKRNYILDEKVSGKVSIYLPGKVSTDESISILDSVLALKGFTAVPIGENLWKIVPAKDAKQSTIPLITENRVRGPHSAATATMVTRLHSLKYVGAEDMKQILAPLVSGDGLINSYTGTNSLIIIDSENNIERLIKLATELDVPFSDREMTIVPVKHADAADIATKLNEILATGDKSADGGVNSIDAVRSRLRDSSLAQQAQISGQPPQRINAAASEGGVAKSATIGGQAREPKIIADERTNSIIVVADEDTTARVRALIFQLDSEVDLSGRRFYVYRCQHASAEDLAEVLSGLMGGSTSSSSSASRSAAGDSNETGLNTGSRDRGNRTQSTQNRLSGQQRTPGRSRSENSAQGGGVTSVSLGEDTSITADPATNSLVISASKADYEKVLELLRDLDVKRRQVLVEAMLLEVGINESENVGFEFLTSTGGKDGGVMAQNNFGSLTQLLTDPSKIQGFSMAAASAGTLKLPGGIEIPTQTALITAAKSNDNINVLSAPNILATDNEQAEIVVGENVPFLASKSSSADNLNNTFNQVDRQDVGITLRITPQISSQDYVTLTIFTEVSNVKGDTAASELGPTTTIRTSDTTVITKDNQMVVIGGLMADVVQDQERGVPFLKDIPLLGSLFKTSGESKKKTNLLILITPRIIKDQFDARDTTIQHRDQYRDELARDDIYPNREEVLNSVDIDHVTESTSYDGQTPSTILPPVTTNQKLSQGSAPVASTNQGSSAGSDVIELRVTPKIPTASIKPQSNESSRVTEPKARMEASNLSRAGDRYVVFDIVGAGKSGALKGAPFTPVKTKNGSRFGVILPGNSNQRALGFFSVGGSYIYGSSGEPLKLQATSILDSPEDARRMHPELPSKWYVLSPYEIMNLGSAPWRNAH